MQNLKVIFIHGNGNSTPNDNWFPYVKNKLEKLNVKVIAQQFPDIPLAREKYWLPFLKELGADQHTILIGHSSGALAAMRFAENNILLGSVLVSAMHTDLGIESEKLSGYYNRPFNWQAIRDNQKWIVQFASTDDPWIPIEEPRFINKQLKTKYYEFNNQGHFGGDYHKAEFPELVEAIKNQDLRMNTTKDLIRRV
jgi:uncharacterized protein